MLNPNGINLNANYGRVWTPGQPLEQKPGEKHSQPYINPDVFRPSEPEVYRPANPHVPGPLPHYPSQPTWLPPVPSGPIIEVPPNQSPMELPPFPGHDDWGSLPKPPAEMPDWSKMPKHFPAPEPLTIEIPGQGPNFPGKTFPDGTWLLS